MIKPSTAKLTQPIPIPWNGIYSLNNACKASGAQPAVSRPLINAEIIVKAIVHAYMIRRPPRRPSPKAKNIITIVNGYKSINTGIAALIIVFKPNRPNANAATENKTTNAL